MDASTHREWEKELSKPEGVATFEKLSAFLKESAMTLKIIELSNPSENHRSFTRRAESHRSPGPKSTPAQAKHCKMLTISSAEMKCLVCDNQHRISRCEKFASLTSSRHLEIVRRARLCFNCLSSGKGSGKN